MLKYKQAENEAFAQAKHFNNLISLWSQSHHSGIETRKLGRQPLVTWKSQSHHSGIETDVSGGVEGHMETSQSHHSGIET